MYIFVFISITKLLYIMFSINNIIWILTQLFNTLILFEKLDDNNIFQMNTLKNNYYFEFISLFNKQTALLN